MERVNEPRVHPPKAFTEERRKGTRYLLSLELRYAVSGQGPGETGSGRTMDLSSSGLAFTADRPLAAGQKLDVSIGWPARLEGRIQLQLVMAGVVVRTLGNTAALRIQAYEFRTRPTESPKPRPPLEAFG